MGNKWIAKPLPGKSGKTWLTKEGESLDGLKARMRAEPGVNLTDYEFVDPPGELVLDISLPLIDNIDRLIQAYRGKV